MHKVSVNKSELQKQLREQARLAQILPSLDLKRKQLSAALAQERDLLRGLQHDLEQITLTVGQDMPMLGAPSVPLDGLIAVSAVHLEDENLLGVRLPRLASLQITRQPYAWLGYPHWVDWLLQRLEAHVRLATAATVREERIRRMERALRKTLQRVNLVEKVLLPRCRGHIRQIRIGLADAERSAVIRSKLIKARLAP